MLGYRRRSTRLDDIERMKEIFRTKLPFPVFRIYTDTCLIPTMYIRIRDTMSSWLSDLKIDIDEKDDILHCHALKDNMTWDEFPEVLMNSMTAMQMKELARASIMAEAWKIIFNKDEIDENMIMMDADDIIHIKYNGADITWNAMTQDFISMRRNWQYVKYFTACEPDLMFIPLEWKKRVEYVREAGKKFGQNLVESALKFAMTDNNGESDDDCFGNCRYIHSEYICGILNDMGFSLTKAGMRYIYFNDDVVHGVIKYGGCELIVEVKCIYDHKKYTLDTRLYSTNVKYIRSRIVGFINKARRDLMNGNVNKAGSGWGYYGGATFF